MNTVTLLGAEVFGRSYGGGVLKMEPREAAVLPVPSEKAIGLAWKTLGPERESLEQELQDRLLERERMWHESMKFYCAMFWE